MILLNRATLPSIPEVSVMGGKVFNNEIFDEWLTCKSQEILSKVDRERITTEEMIVLVLKAQTNHFEHMDREFRGEFGSIRQQFSDMKAQFAEIDQRFEKIDQKFEKIDKKMDDRFDRQNRFLMWQGGAILALFSGLYLKLFLG